MKRYTFLKRLIRAYRVEMIRACASAQSSSLRSNTNSRGLCLAGWILHNPIHQKKPPEKAAFFGGGDDQTRTDYLYVANVSLYRVSYIPVF